MQDFNKVNIRSTHPNLYYSLVVFAVINIGLGVNFLLTNPTFNPYQIDKAIIGGIFLALGLLKIIFLRLFRNLKILRLVMASEVFFMLFWGIGTTITFFRGQTSLQLFVLYAGLAALEAILLLEPVVNPMSEIKKDE